MSKFKRKSLTKANKEHTHDMNVSLISADNFQASKSSTEGGDVAEGYQFDFALILPNPEHPDYKDKGFSPDMSLEEIVERLHIGGLQTYVFRAADDEEFVVKCRVPLRRLKEFAEDIEFDMKVDERYLEDVVDNRKNRIAHDPRTFSVYLELIYRYFIIILIPQILLNCFHMSSFMQITSKVHSTAISTFFLPPVLFVLVFCRRH